MDIRSKTINKMVEYFGDDQRRIQHALKVLKFSEEILHMEEIKGKQEIIVILTAILHDIGIHAAEEKYNSNAGKYQEIEGPPIARKMMEEISIENKIIERVCAIIGGHHTPSKVDGIDFQIIWEADLMVNIEEDGLNKDNSNLEHIINKNFKTTSGKSIAQKLYL